MERASPAKRPRTTLLSGVDASEISSSIQQAITSNERSVVLDRFLNIIGYNDDTDICNNEKLLVDVANAGTINSLCYHLGFVLYRNGALPEIEKICKCLGILFSQCPGTTSEESMEALGSGFVQLLLKAATVGATQSVLSIWHSFSANVVGTTLLLQCSGVLAIVVEVLHRESIESRGLLDALGMLKNATYYGEDLRHVVVEEPGLISGLSRLVFNNRNGKQEERVSAIFRNLAISPSTRTVLAQKSEVLSALSRISNSSNRTTLRNLLNALISMAVDVESCLFLVLHGDGILIDICKRLIGHENDEMIRKRSARAIRLMARDSAAPFLVADSLLIDTLTRRVLNDKSKAVRAEAAEALARCAGLVDATMGHHSKVLDTLTKLANNPNVSPDIVARAFKDQASHFENRVSMGRRNQLINAIADIAISFEASPTAKEDSCHALFRLSCDETNRDLMASPPIFEALVRNSTRRQGESERTREFAVRSLSNLALNTRNRSNMAKHAALLQALLQFVSSTTNEMLKRDVKSLILKLAAEL